MGGIIAVNPTGAFNVTKPFSEVRSQQNSGRIITISSIAAIRAPPDGLSYDAFKEGLEGNVRPELSKTGESGDRTDPASLCLLGA